MTKLLPRIAQTPLLLALFALLAGSLAAPSIYVFTGFTNPEGFHDLRGADLSTTLLAFVTAWLFSAFLTGVVGGALWVPLHILRYDSFISYLLVSVISYILLSLVAGAEQWLTGISMAVANAIAVRLVERTVGRFPHETT
ncbi:MAG: hypothetical protein Q8N96_14735 [Methylovulum sp.]|nr:hypothetical protein [Methylovulum sp.]